MSKNPTIILVKPQMGENIGAAARGMLNFGLSELALVQPRDGWPSERAEAMSSGALEIMPPVEVFDSTPAALAPYHHVYATTARPRDMVKPVMTARAAAEDMRTRAAQGQRTAILFGGERAGLDNDDVALAETIITLPANPDFSSINLGQAVLLCAYEWMQSCIHSPSHPADGSLPLPMGEGNEASLPRSDSAVGEGLKYLPATQKDFEALMVRLEEELEIGGFFPAPDMKPTTVRNVRSLFTRMEMTDQEVRTFHGIISALIGKKKNNKKAAG